MVTGELASGPTLPIHCQLADVWSQMLGVNVVSIHASFFDLGGTNAVAAQMLHNVSRITGRNVSFDAFKAGPTIRVLADMLVTGPRVGETFVTVQPGNGSLPFFYFHGDILGGGFYSQRLAEMLGPDRPFFVSPPLELFGDELPDIEEIASRKRHALLAKLSEGPCVLGGYCVGGVVAYEIARQLQANGRKVAGVIMIEPEVGDPVERSQLKLLELAGQELSPRAKVAKFARMQHRLGRIRQVWKSPLTEKVGFILRHSRGLLSWEEAAPEPDRGVASAPAETLDRQRPLVANANGREWMLDAYAWILTSYIPKPYSGRVKLFITEQNQLETPHVKEQFKKAAPAAEIQQIPGNHLECITTHLDSLGENVLAELRCLDALKSGPPLGSLLSPA